MRRVLAALALIASPAFAATVTHEAATADTGSSPNTSAAFTPVAGDVLVVGVCATSTTQATATLTSSIGGFTFTQVTATNYDSTTDRAYLFVSDQQVSDTSSQTVTVDMASDAADGTAIIVAAVAGLSRDGADAIKQSANETGTAAAAIDPTFGGSALTGNPTLGFACNKINPATLTEPSGWTEGGDIGYASPDTGMESAYRDSGFTGTAITWVSLYGTNGASIIVEMDSSATTPTYSVSPAVGTRTASSIPITQTTVCTDCTAYGVAVTDGSGAPTCTQIKAGQDSTGSAAYKTFSGAMTASSQFTGTFGTYTNGAVRDGYFCMASTANGDSAVASIADMVKLPAFTAGPTAGTKTDTTIPFTFTVDTTGTVYGVACPDGQASPSVAQVKAGNCTGDIAAVSAFSEAVVLTVSDGDSFTGLTGSTTYDTHFVSSSSGGDEAAITSVANQTTNAPAAGVFTVNPTVTSQTAVQYVLGGTTGASAAISAVACAKDSTAPSIAQVEAGDCTGDVNAIASQNDTWNGADSLTLGGSLTFPVHDLYITDGTNLVTLIDEFLDPATGKQFQVLSSVHADSMCFGQTPAVVAGDIVVLDTTTDPGTYVITPFNTCLYNIAAAGDTSQQLIDWNVYDVSLAQMYGAAIEAVNNLAPLLVDDCPFTSGGDLIEVGTDPSEDLSDCIADPEGDSIAYSLDSGALPDDFLLSSAGVYSDGVPGSCGTYTWDVEVLDEYGASIILESELDVGAELPDLSGMTLAEAIAIIAALCP